MCRDSDPFRPVAELVFGLQWVIQTLPVSMTRVGKTALNTIISHWRLGSPSTATLGKNDRQKSPGHVERPKFGSGVLEMAHLRSRSVQASVSSGRTIWSRSAEPFLFFLFLSHPPMLRLNWEEFHILKFRFSSTETAYDTKGLKTNCITVHHLNC